MRTRFWSPLLVAALWAQTATADPAVEARFHDERARRAFAARDYETALEEFFLVRRLIPNPRTSFNAALCLELLQRDAEAYMHFDDFLAATADEPGLDEMRGHARASLARIGPKVALVRVATEPPGATIRVDKPEHGSYGATPRTLALAPGKHQIWAELPGYRVASAELLAERGQTTELRLTLARITGKLVVRSRVPVSARVLAPNGALVAHGPTPLERALPPGPYQVTTTARGYRPWRGLGALEPERTLFVDATPEPLPPEVGELTVTANVSGAVIALDGKPVGFTPAVIPNVPVGAHHLELRSEGRVPYAETIAIAADERAWVTVELGEPATRVRPPAVWALGAGGLTALLAGGATAAVAATRRSEFDSADPAEQAAIRDAGRTANATADVLLVTGVSAASASVLLYFTTARVRGGASRASIAREAR